MASPALLAPTSEPPSETNAGPPGLDRYVLFPARAFLAFGWLRAGIEKLIEPSWWSGHDLEGFVADQESAMLPFMQSPVEAIVTPSFALTAAIIAVAELVVGGLLLTGRRLMTALLAACGLNVIFVLMGVVTPSAFYLVIQLTLVLWLLGRGRRWTPRHRLGLLAAMGAATVAAVPFIRTIHPAEVIHDPAIMLATIAALVGATQLFSLIEERFHPRQQR